MGLKLLTAERIGGNSTCEVNKAGQVISARDTYQVLATVNSTQSDVLSATGLPTPGSAHPVLTGIYLTRLIPKQDRNGQRWEVDCHYERLDGSTSGGGGGIGGLKLSYSFDSEEETEDLLQDAVTGDLIANTAGDIIPMKLQRRVVIARITVQAEYASGTPNFSTLAAMNGTVNSNAVTIRGYTVPVGCGLMRISCEDTPGEGYRVTYSILCRKKRMKWKDINGGMRDEDIGWDEVIPNVGYFHWDEDGEKKVRAGDIMLDAEGKPIKDDYGNVIPVPTPEPVKLDAEGERTEEVLAMRVAFYPRSTWHLPSG